MTDDDIQQLRAVAHPVRLRILSLLTGSAMSAAEVARELDLTHANASYHLRILLESGTVVEAGEERIRGGVAKRYRYPHEDRDQHRSRATTEDRVAKCERSHASSSGGCGSASSTRRTISATSTAGCDPRSGSACANC